MELELSKWQGIKLKIHEGYLLITLAFFFFVALTVFLFVLGGGEKDTGFWVTMCAMLSPLLPSAT